MIVKELLNKINKIIEDCPDYWLDQEVMILNNKGLYCETTDVEIDGKDRICIVEMIYSHDKNN